MDCNRAEVTGMDYISCTDLLSALDTQANVSIVVTNNNKRLEPCSLTSTCLLLHWHDLHDLILQGRAQEGLYNLVLLDLHGEKVDLLQRLDLALQLPLTRLMLGKVLLELMLSR